jgi:hypothetical protein
MPEGKSEIPADLSEAVRDFKEALPGWWFTVGECSVSCDATVGPDVAYCPQWMLDKFDAGFDCDLAQPSTLASALRGATEIALNAINKSSTEER